jgi:hypothetical protein
MATKQFWYSVGTETKRHPCECNSWHGIHGMVECAANNYDSLTAGEAEWPQQITIYWTADGPVFGRMEVLAEVQLIFTAVGEVSNGPL